MINTLYKNFHYGERGGKNSVYFNIDTNKNLLQLNGEFLNKPVTIEYISNGITPDSDVPRIAKQVIRTYIHWQKCLFSSDINEQRKAPYFEQQYSIELVKLNQFLNSFTYDELVDTFRKSEHQNIKLQR